MTFLQIPTALRTIQNFSDGQWVGGSGETLTVTSPYTGQPVAQLSASTVQDVSEVVQAAHGAFPAWAGLPLRERVSHLRKFARLLEDRADELSTLIAIESGKTPAEAKAGLQRGLEVIDFAASLPNADTGAVLDVSRGVSCHTRRMPLGVVAGITPFNFPGMVPLWMLPAAVTLGNCFVLKPSEKVPGSASVLAELMTEAGYPPGVFSVVHGGANTVRALVDNSQLKAVGFVGSTAVARSIYAQAATGGKRALCLGGAKNAIVAAPDADPTLTARAVVDSFTGCAGQRCMATSVLILVGDRAAADTLLELVVRRAGQLSLGADMGALIDRGARTRLVTAIEKAEQAGARVLLDGRKSEIPKVYASGSWLGPTILDAVGPADACVREELFGPLLCVMRTDTLDEALRFEHKGVYGNALSVFTNSGGVARQVAERAASGMVGINVGVPVPREPFSFGGTKSSKFGHGDITGPSSLDFWSDLKKVTTKWQAQTDATWMS